MIVAIGANGLAKQVYPLIEGSSDLIFVDTKVQDPHNFKKHRLVNDFSVIEKSLKSGEDVLFIICIGDPRLRKHFHEKMIEMNATPANLISEEASVAFDMEMGEGNLILDYSLIETDVKIGTGNLINCFAGIFHDVEIGDFNEIMPGAKILGTAKIGNTCRIGSNATILPGVEICDGVVIGAGAVVTHSITEPGTYVGMPARKVR